MIIFKDPFGGDQTKGQDRWIRISGENVVIFIILLLRNRRENLSGILFWKISYKMWWMRVGNFDKLFTLKSGIQLVVQGHTLKSILDSGRFQGQNRKKWPYFLWLIDLRFFYWSIIDNSISLKNWSIPVRVFENLLMKMHFLNIFRNF